MDKKQNAHTKKNNERGENNHMVWELCFTKNNLDIEHCNLKAKIYTYFSNFKNLFYQFPDFYCQKLIIFFFVFL